MRKSKDDRDKAINLYLWEKQACSTCGTRPQEWDPEHGGNRHAYSAALGHCRGCQELEAMRESMKAGPQIKGTYITLQRNHFEPLGVSGGRNQA